MANVLLTIKDGVTFGASLKFSVGTSDENSKVLDTLVWGSTDTSNGRDAVVNTHFGRLSESDGSYTGNVGVVFDVRAMGEWDVPETPVGAVKESRFSKLRYEVDFDDAGSQLYVLEDSADFTIPANFKDGNKAYHPISSHVFKPRGTPYNVTIAVIEYDLLTHAEIARVTINVPAFTVNDPDVVWALIRGLLTLTDCGSA
jgi:hypothetical protein